MDLQALQDRISFTYLQDQDLDMMDLQTGLLGMQLLGLQDLMHDLRSTVYVSVDTLKQISIKAVQMVSQFAGNPFVAL